MPQKNHPLLRSHCRKSNCCLAASNEPNILDNSTQTKRFSKCINSDFVDQRFASYLSKKQHWFKPKRLIYNEISGIQENLFNQMKNLWITIAFLVMLCTLLLINFDPFWERKHFINSSLPLGTFQYIKV